MTEICRVKSATEDHVHAALDGMANAFISDQVAKMRADGVDPETIKAMTGYQREHFRREKAGLLVDLRDLAAKK